MQSGGQWWCSRVFQSGVAASKSRGFWGGKEGAGRSTGKLCTYWTLYMEMRWAEPPGVRLHRLDLSIYSIFQPAQWIRLLEWESCAPWRTWNEENDHKVCWTPKSSWNQFGFIMESSINIVPAPNGSPIFSGQETSCLRTRAKRGCRGSRCGQSRWTTCVHGILFTGL